ncbi:hypothetical protein FJTKL_11684 [Diaporthe vaccinii]|uniref:Uncharacterized protein n=1 Tax=Diaporthe vaccinii TaxID=105482 RepID=A0ABR4EFN1_9PEZI
MPTSTDTELQREVRNILWNQISSPGSHTSAQRSRGNASHERNMRARGWNTTLPDRHTTLGSRNRRQQITCPSHTYYQSGRWGEEQSASDRSTAARVGERLTFGDRELGLLEVELEVNGLEAQDARPQKGEENDAGAVSSSDSEEEPTDYSFCRKRRRRESDDFDSDQSDQASDSESDESSSDEHLMDRGEIDDAESDYDEDFQLEGGHWRRPYNRHDGRKRDRERLYELGKREHEAGIQRRALLGKLARIGGSAASPAPPEARFAPWKTVDWTAPDVPTDVQAAVDGSRLPLQALERVIAFFDANPDVDRGRCDAFCLEAYLSSSSLPCATHACVSEFQFADSYMVEMVEEVEEEEASAADDGADARMTLFCFTSAPVHEAAITAARKAYGDFVPKYTRVGALALGPGQPELPVFRIECTRGRPLSAEAARLTLAVNGPRYEAVLRSTDLNVVAWPTAPYNPRCGPDNLIVRPGMGGVGGLLFWPAPAPVELPLGAALCGLLPALGKPMRPPAEIDPRSKYPSVVDLLPFQGHRRDGDRFQLPCMEQLQAQDAMPAVESDPQPWQRIFAAMAEGVDLATDIADADQPYYKHEIKILSGAWFYARLGAYSIRIKVEEDKGRGT